MILSFFFLVAFGLPWLTRSHHSSSDLERLYFEKFFRCEQDDVEFSTRFDGQPANKIPLFSLEGLLQLQRSSQGLFVYFLRPGAYQYLIRNIGKEEYRKFSDAIKRIIIESSDNSSFKSVFRTFVYHIRLTYVNPVILKTKSRKWYPGWSSLVAYAALKDASLVHWYCPQYIGPLRAFHIINKFSIQGVVNKPHGQETGLDKRLMRRFQIGLSLWRKPINKTARSFLYYEDLPKAFPIIETCSSEMLMQLLVHQHAFDFCIHLPLKNVGIIKDEIISMGFYPMGTEVIYQVLRSIVSVEGIIEIRNLFVRRCSVKGWESPEDITNRLDLEKKCHTRRQLNEMSRKFELQSDFL